MKICVKTRESCNFSGKELWKYFHFGKVWMLRIWILLSFLMFKITQISIRWNFNIDENHYLIIVQKTFSLVNSLLVNDPETFRRNLAIQRFAVIPLSTNSGLIGWVPHSDTLHGLIKDYREKKKIVLNLEHRLMQRMSPDYDHLPLMNKVEVFEHSLELTQGDDLAKLMLLKSPSSEVWFDRRTNFTRSLAVMSMVSEILVL